MILILSYFIFVILYFCFSYLLCKRLIQVCELVSHLSSSRIPEERLILDDTYFGVPITWNDEDILLQLKSEVLVASKSALTKITDAELYKDSPLPDLSPMSPIVSLEKTHFYRFKDEFRKFFNHLFLLFYYFVQKAFIVSLCLLT